MSILKVIDFVLKKLLGKLHYILNDPRNFEPHFYIVKQGFTGVYIIFLTSAQNIDCGYSLEPPWRCFYLKTSIFWW